MTDQTLITKDQVKLTRGNVVWADLAPAIGHEQSGRRPVLVVASNRYLDTLTSLAIVVPVTTVDRGWPNHVRLDGDSSGLGRPSFAMTEQPRTIDRGRIYGIAGRVDSATMDSVDLWLRDFLDLPLPPFIPPKAGSV